MRGKWALAISEVSHTLERTFRDLTNAYAGIIATYIFPASDAKHYYHKGYSICLGFLCLAAASSLAYFIACWTQNKAKERAGPDLSLTEYEKLEKGDLNADYRYML